MTAPNSVAQADLLVEVYRRAGIDPRTVICLEVHGTGTPLGDPVEVGELNSAFRQLYRDWDVPPTPTPYCGPGSVKTHVGHLELAAGAAGLAKVLLQIRHRTLIANLHVGELNPHIYLAGTPFQVVRANRPWTTLRDENGRELPRRAGISSFGYGGVNAHVVVEEYPSPPSADADDGRPVALVLSARDETRLTEACRDLKTWIAAHREGGRALLAGCGVYPATGSGCDGGALGANRHVPGRGRGQTGPIPEWGNRNSGNVERFGAAIRDAGADCLATFAPMGLVYGPSHQGLVSVAVGEKELLAEIVLLRESADLSPAWVMNPALLDAALQASAGFSVGADGRFGTVRAEVPVAVRELIV